MSESPRVIRLRVEVRREQHSDDAPIGIEPMRRGEAATLDIEVTTVGEAVAALRELSDAGLVRALPVRPEADAGWPRAKQ